MKNKAKEKAADEGKAPRRRCQDERAKTMMMMRMCNRGERGRESGRQLCVVVAQIEVNCI